MKNASSSLTERGACLFLLSNLPLFAIHSFKPDDFDSLPRRASLDHYKCDFSSYGKWKSLPAQPASTVQNIPIVQEDYRLGPIPVVATQPAAEPADPR